METFPGRPLKTVSDNVFDAYLVLDPTERSVHTNMYFFPRPLTEYLLETGLDDKSRGQIKIGSYGLAIENKMKGYLRLINAANFEFESAEINLHLPVLKNKDKEFQNSIIRELNYKNKKNFKINISMVDFTHEELVNWCRKNTINVFLYDRLIGTGLSATTDQAIESGRPLLVSTNSTFRHIHPYITPYPLQTLTAAIETSKQGVEKMQKDWSRDRFRNQFEKILEIHASNEFYRL